MDIAFSFDTTGSMYPCLTQVRRYVEETVKKLFKEIPNLRIAVISHGDYCDRQDMINILDFTNNEAAVCKFIKETPATSGGDAPECYEYVLNRAQALNWGAIGQKAFVMIGDATPHRPGDGSGSKHHWRDEAEQLSKTAKLYSVQCLGRRESNSFWQGISDFDNGYYLTLDQFSEVTELLMAIVYKQADKLWDFETFLSKQGRVGPSVSRALDVLSGRKVKVKKNALSAFAVHPARFQIIPVDKDAGIKEFVLDQGLTFKKGRGFYEFTKPVVVQDYKEVIIRDRDTGDMFSGDKAREILGIPVGVKSKVKPNDLTKYQGFIQSTSVNRKLIGGTAFLYEVEDV